MTQPTKFGGESNFVRWPKSLVAGDEQAASMTAEEISFRVVVSG